MNFPVRFLAVFLVRTKQSQLLIHMFIEYCVTFFFGGRGLFWFFLPNLWLCSYKTDVLTREFRQKSYISQLKAISITNALISLSFHQLQDQKGF